MTSGSAARLSHDLRVAVLGVGRMGSFHVDALSTRVRGAEVVVVSDVDSGRARVVADTVGARTVDDPLEAIRDADVDAVLIATPGPAHADQVLACLEVGRPVLCEKPLATDADAAYRIAVAEAALPRPLVQVGFMRRFDPEYVQLRELIVSGDLGNPLMVHCVHRNLSSPETFDSDFMIRDSVVHEVDVARFLLGEEIIGVQVVSGVATAGAPDGVQDPMLVIFRTASGRIVTDEIFVRSGIGYEVRTEVVGERGSARIGRGQNLITTTVNGRWGGTIPPGFIERFGLAYDLELTRWVAAARAGTIDGPGVWDGYAAAAVCEAGVRAVRSGDPVAVQLRPRPQYRPRVN